MGSIYCPLGLLDTKTQKSEKPFEGIQHYHPNSLIPVKKTRKSTHNPDPPPLTGQQKKSNRPISSFRVITEHAQFQE